MATPQNKQSKSRSAMRRAHNMRRAAPNGSACPRCGEKKLPHRACLSCGYYRDRVAVEPKEEESS